ncbi:hypothetical protein L1987_31520 [Smallanthus sonchifolius]|uniref:Uncharacterized protein n=1 Tax=Smallanthus sonchifolius TaxID=185202 RepID=A0ACB9I5T0_9ASTR|nr:hypothetical protein L1987_31520 [Smallanthus sonchifolius]
MSDETPKLYVHKPKKAQLKKHLQQQSRSSPPPPPSPSPSPVTSSSSSSMASQSTTSSALRVPPPPPKESFARRYKFLWPLLLAVNFSIGAYLFLRTKKKENIEENAAAVTSTPTSAISTASVSSLSTSHPVVVEPTKVLEPIPMDQQRELFKWILEEKRKIKPKDPEEKKKIDEEKAILKQFIRAKSIPPF